MADGKIQVVGGKVLVVGGKIATADECCCVVECLDGTAEDDCTGITDVTDLDMLVDLGTDWVDGIACDCDVFDDAEYALAYTAVGPYAGTWFYEEEDWCADINHYNCAYTGPAHLVIMADITCSGSDTCVVRVRVRFYGPGDFAPFPYEPDQPWQQTWYYFDTYTDEGAKTSWTLPFSSVNQEIIPNLPPACMPCNSTPDPESGGNTTSVDLSVIIP